MYIYMYIYIYKYWTIPYQSTYTYYSAKGWFCQPINHGMFTIKPSTGTGFCNHPQYSLNMYN